MNGKWLGLAVPAAVYRAQLWQAGFAAYGQDNTDAIRSNQPG